ncbi:hypothetical protein Y032_0051g2084 [Ancylostoma ceylanicum]|uniref:C-type lectin domain-containing protein n=1 Tax=Ancylostoma ceylanicum TaxID=53326 RepID=A0A016U7R8_9BILA|nr:hypothetical protein Y032_0051g2084 [Ancylostoma ceylanicum]
MVAFFQLLVVMSVLSVSTTHDKIRIREGGWKKFSSFEYKVYSSWEKFNFVEAEAYCRNRSAHLVSIHSDEESEFVNNLLGTSRHLVWIGLVHDDMGRLMAWTDGSPFDYVRWSYGHPVSEDSDAAAFGVVADKDDVVCKSQIRELRSVDRESFVFPIQSRHGILQCGREQFWRNSITLSDTFFDWNV